MFFIRKNRIRFLADTIFFRFRNIGLVLSLYSVPLLYSVTKNETLFATKAKYLLIDKSNVIVKKINRRLLVTIFFPRKLTVKLKSANS